MESYACRNGDYFFLVNNLDINTLKDSSIESNLLFEGGDSTGKISRLSFDVKAHKKISLRFLPSDDLGYEYAQKVELIINSRAYDELYFGGYVVGIDSTFSLIVKDMNS